MSYCVCARTRCICFEFQPEPQITRLLLVNASELDSAALQEAVIKLVVEAQRLLTDSVVSQQSATSIAAIHLHEDKEHDLQALLAKAELKYAERGKVIPSLVCLFAWNRLIIFFVMPPDVLRHVDVLCVSIVRKCQDSFCFCTDVESKADRKSSIPRFYHVLSCPVFIVVALSYLCLFRRWKN